MTVSDLSLSSDHHQQHGWMWLTTITSHRHSQFPTAGIGWWQTTSITRSAKTIMPTGRETQKENNEEKGTERRQSKTENQKEGWGQCKEEKRNWVHLE